MNPIEEIKKELENKTPQEILNHYKDKDMKPFDRLNYAYVRVRMIVDFMKVIDNHGGELMEPGNQVAHHLNQRGKGIKPSQMLNEYIVQEISSFYTLVFGYQKQNPELPSAPDYWLKLKEFRNSIPGHLDNDHNLKDLNDWCSVYEMIDEIKLPEIIADFEERYKKCVSILGDKI